MESTAARGRTNGASILECDRHLSNPLHATCGAAPLPIEARDRVACIEHRAEHVFADEGSLCAADGHRDDALKAADAHAHDRHRVALHAVDATDGLVRQGGVGGDAARARSLRVDHSGCSVARVE
eukprot:scaffold13931_cov59-Phaeocystis_antarctica.AAC.1